MNIPDIDFFLIKLCMRLFRIYFCIIFNFTNELLHISCAFDHTVFRETLITETMETRYSDLTFYLMCPTIF